MKRWNYELEVAAKLAPDNALIFYDLGVVLKLQGKESEAKAAIKRSLAIGLPATTKAKAESLLRSLDTSSAGSSKPKASLSEITTWIQEFMAENDRAHASCDNHRGGMFSLDTLVNVRITGCSVKLYWTMTAEDVVRQESDSTYTFELSQMRFPPKISREETSRCSPDHFYVVEMFTGSGTVKAHLSESRDGRETKSEDTEYSSAQLKVASEDLANRLRAALSDAIKLCGGQASKQLY
jgi:hypothetical protein